jgi:hypothetical protein
VDPVGDVGAMKFPYETEWGPPKRGLSFGFTTFGHLDNLDLRNGNGFSTASFSLRDHLGLSSLSCNSRALFIWGGVVGWGEVMLKEMGS